MNEMNELNENDSEPLFEINEKIYYDIFGQGYYQFYIKNGSLQIFCFNKHYISHTIAFQAIVLATRLIKLGSFIAVDIWDRCVVSKNDAEEPYLLYGGVIYGPVTLELMDTIWFMMVKPELTP
jgi:hypothetical protein